MRSEPPSLPKPEEAKADTEQQPPTKGKNEKKNQEAQAGVEQNEERGAQQLTAAILNRQALGEGSEDEETANVSDWLSTVLR